MNIGCHAVLFKERIANDTEAVLSSLKQAGAQGAEIGSRFFGVENCGQLNEALEKTGMKLSGLHAGPTLLTLLDEPEKALEQLEGAARFLQHVDCKDIIMTGGLPRESFSLDNLGDDRLTTPESARKIAENLNDIAVYLKETYGVQINYHNHNWEFKNGAVIFHALVDHAPAVCFALDTGWAAVSGYDPIQLIKNDCKGRIHYVHLRDYSKAVVEQCKDFDELQNSYTALGEGDMDYPALLSALEEALGENGWAVVEYETGPEDAGRYEKAVSFVRGVLAQLHG